MLTLFLLSIVLDRDFYIDADNPLPWHMLYEPNRIDWRVHHLGSATQRGLFHTHDQRMYDDFDDLAASDADPLVVLANLREFDNLLRWVPEETRRIFEQPYVYSTLWHYLFRPSFALEEFLVENQDRLGLNEPYIGIHIRIGNRSSWWDPSRHTFEDVSSFLRCAEKAEKEHFSTPVRWFLSTDCTAVYELEEVRNLIAQRKIVYLPSSNTV